MTDNTPPPSNTEATGSTSILRTLRHVNQSAQQLDDNVYRLGKSLEKRGIQLSHELADLTKNIRQGLFQAQREGENLVKQLDQLQKLVQSSALITSSLQLNQVLEQVVDAVISMTGAERAYLMLREPDTDELHVRTRRNWDSQTIPQEEVAFSRSVISEAITKGEPIVTTNALDDARFQYVESVVAHGLRSILCIPLTLDSVVIGVLYADDRIRPGIFSQDIVPLLAAFGAQAAISIEKARLHEEEIQMQRLEEELSVGQRIQMSLLPKGTPSIPGWQFAAMYRPARIVGGDFYDFFDLPGGDPSDPYKAQGLVVADVADKGIGAAIFMALSRTMIRTTALTGASPSDALRQANDLILDNSQSDLFLTAFYAVLDTHTGELVFANAGHNWPLLLRASPESVDSATIERLVARGIILGSFSPVTLEEKRSNMAVGDVLVLFTDGITEAMNVHEEEYGEARLRDVIFANSEGTAQEICEAICAAVDEFTESAPQSDDLTIVVVKRIES